MRSSLARSLAVALVYAALTAVVVGIGWAIVPTVVDQGAGLTQDASDLVAEAWIAAYSAPEDHSPEQRASIGISNDLVAEFLAVDVVVLGAPMYNFGVPAVLKAYIDQIVRVGRTFTPDGRGLVAGKQVYVVTVRGLSGYGPGQAMHGMDYEDPYLRAIFGFIGVTDITFVDVENGVKDEEGMRASLTLAQSQIAAAVVRATLSQLAGAGVGAPELVAA